MAVADAVCRNWHLASHGRNALSAQLLACAQDILRVSRLERAEMATGTLALAASLSTLQSPFGYLAGALSLAIMPALRIWRDRGFCKRATRVTAADDHLFSSPVVRVAVVEHRGQCSACSVDCSCTAGVAALAAQRTRVGSFIQIDRRDQLADGPQCRSIFAPQDCDATIA